MQIIYPINYDVMNLIVAILALLIALYSIWYTRHCNKRKILITNGEFISTANNPPIARFEMFNMSPVPVTVLNVDFFSDSKFAVEPILNYEPKQTYTLSGPYSTEIPDIISGYQYADIIDTPTVILPYNSLELGYYFKEIHSTLTLKVICDERIHHFKKHQSFFIHFSDIQE